MGEDALDMATTRGAHLQTAKAFVDAHGDADQVTAGGSAGGAVEPARKRATAPMGRGQVLGDALAVHERSV